MKNPFEKRMEIVFGISRGLLIYLLYVIVTFPASF